jgi:predicted GNAT family acetyltransferase/glutaredoxin
VLTLYQAEWCPYSSAVREALTELGLDVVVRQVEPEPEDRASLRSISGGDSIPVLETEDGEVIRGMRSIFRFLEGVEPWQHADAHRQKFVEHADARAADAPGKLVARFRHDRPGPPVEATPQEARVVDVPGESRYELRLGDRRIGLAAYHRRGGTVAFTHTEVDAACEGRGFGTRLVNEALADAEAQGLEVVPLCPFVAAVARRRVRGGA